MRANAEDIKENKDRFRHLSTCRRLHTASASSQEVGRNHSDDINDAPEGKINTIKLVQFGIKCKWAFEARPSGTRLFHHCQIYPSLGQLGPWNGRGMRSGGMAMFPAKNAGARSTCHCERFGSTCHHKCFVRSPALGFCL